MKPNIHTTEIHQNPQNTQTNIFKKPQYPRAAYLLPSAFKLLSDNALMAYKHKKQTKKNVRI